MRAIFVALGAVVAIAEPLYAQVLAPAAKVTVPPTPSEAYTYKPDGRRDPFVSLIGTGVEPRTSRRGDGLGAFGVGELAVRGVLQSRNSLIAMVQGPDNKTYLIHAGDKLADGVVKRVTPEGIVVVQQISDPRSTEKQREVRKLLRSLEDVKE